MQLIKRLLFNHEVIDILLAGGKSLGDIEIKGVIVKEIETGETKSVQADIVADDTGFKAILRTKLPSSTGLDFEQFLRIGIWLFRFSLKNNGEFFPFFLTIAF